MENDYDRHTDGQLPANTTTKKPWTDSMFGALGTIGGAYFNSIAPQQVAEDNSKNKNTTIIVVVGVIVIAAVIYFVSKKSK